MQRLKRRRRQRARLPVECVLPTYAVGPGHILLREIDGRTCSNVKLGKMIVCQHLPAAFHETRRVAAVRY